MVIASPAARLNAMIARFDPAIQKIVRQARTRLRKRLPAAVELVYDNYNALAIGYGSSEKRGDWIVSLAVYAGGVNLYFVYGIALADPHGLLLGAGHQGRFIRLESAAMLDRREIGDLIEAAIADTDTPLAKRARGYTLIKSVSPNQRRRRRPGRARHTTKAAVSPSKGREE
jgi:hypothetical protein